MRLILAFCLLSTVTQGTEWMITNSTGLRTNLVNANIAAGDTLWLTSGTYTGHYTCTIKGTPSSPIVVRNYQKGRVIIDAYDLETSAYDAITVNGGSNVWFWGLEIMNHNTNRVSSQSGPFPTDVPYNYAYTILNSDGIRIINNVIHDNPAALGLWNGASNTVAYGNLIYQVGWLGSDRAHAHGIYSQNLGTMRRLENNLILFPAYAGLQVYGTGDTSKNHEIRGNAMVMAGCLFTNKAGQNIILGGLNDEGSNINYVANQTYHVFGVGDPGTSDSWFGETAGLKNCLIGTNYDAGVTSLWNIDASVQVLSNKFYGTSSGIVTANYPVNVWRTANPTSGTEVFVTTNAYEVGRGHIVVYNWASNATVSADISSLRLAINQSYELHNAFNFYTNYTTNTYTGASISLAMSNRPNATPLGITPITTNTWPVFGAFIIIPGASNNAPTSPLLRLGYIQATFEAEYATNLVGSTNWMAAPVAVTGTWMLEALPGVTSSTQKVFVRLKQSAKEVRMVP